MNTTWYIVASVDLVLATVFSLFVLSRRKRVPAVTLSWILAFFLIPYGGLVFYLFVGYRSISRRKRRMPNPFRKVQEESDAAAELARLDEDLRSVAMLGERLTDFPAVGRNRLVLYTGGASTYAAIAAAIADAKEYIHLEYYIFRPDETGMLFRDLLIHKAQNGVKCRLLVDHIGSFGLTRHFTQPLEQAGVKVAFFFPVRLNRPWGFHLRNHRKLVVVDGVSGFIGSQNIGNEYTRWWKQQKLSWRDTHLKIEGPAVAQLETIFSEDWEFSTGEKSIDLKAPPEIPHCGESVVQMLPTGPDEDQSTLEMILITLVHAAKKRITVMTPYFIPTMSITLALYSAARRGVLVELMVPLASDNWIVDLAARSWYRDLLSEGVVIYQHQETFVHAKVVTVDQRVVLLGSANMDERSFRLNFESSVLVYDAAISRQHLLGFDQMKEHSLKVDLADIEKQAFLADVRDGAFRILSPLL